MDYEWVATGRVYELRKVDKVPWTQTSNLIARYAVGRLRRVKNKRSCKKFALERFEYGRWEYITLLVMKLDEAKEVARTILIAGANDD